MVQVMPPIKGTLDFDALMGVEHSDEPVKLGRLSKQFEGFTGGPAEAHERYLTGKYQEAGALLHEARADPAQKQLFHPESIPPQEAHHQTPEQFARDPRTWWHGRVTKGGPRSSLGGSTVGRGEGFHAGTEGAARQRVTTNVGRRGLGQGMAGRMYPLRITGPVDQPEEARGDMPVHYELGPTRYRYGETVGGRQRGYLYKNEVEGGGQVSVGVPRRKGFMSTQREMVKQAKKEGKYVHPTIDWATQKMPEHTAEEIKPRSLYEQRGWQGHQPTLSDPPRGQSLHTPMSPERQSWIKAMSEERMARTSYKTAAGGHQNVFRWRDPTPGSALSPVQWERGEYRPPPAQYGPASGQSNKDWQHDIFSP